MAKDCQKGLTAQGEDMKQMNANMTGMNANIAAMLRSMQDVQARLPASTSTKRGADMNVEDLKKSAEGADLPQM